MLNPATLDLVLPPRIVFGWGARARLGELSRSLGRRAFVVTGSRSLERSGELQKLFEQLIAVGVEALMVEAIEREPTVDDVDRLITRLREAKAGRGDLLIAIGGGSAIDLAKAASALVTNRGSSTVADYLEGVGKGLKIEEAPLPVLAVPTTAGTGSEATKNAVISSFDPPFKKSIRSEQMVPRIVLVDPELMVTVPPAVTSATGMDAITQLIESFVSRRASPATKAIALAGLEGAVPALREAFQNGTSRPARETMARAALLSGIALANSGLGMAHGVAAALGTHCQVAHGLACAVMLPAALRFNLADPGVARDFSPLIPLVLRKRDVPSDEEARLAIEEIEQLLDDLSLPRRLSELGVARDQLPAIVRDSAGNSMRGNPRDVSDEELMSILEKML